MRGVTKGGGERVKVEMLNWTPDPERTVALSARLCYSSAGIKELQEKLETADVERLLEMVTSRGHHSVLEHASFTFGVEGVSRVLTHQLVRHRLASYSQQSQRYVKAEEFGYIVPPSVAANGEALRVFRQAMGQARKAYSTLLGMGIHREDCRYVIPQGVETKIVVTMNARELLHFFELRCCERAQWEIRNLAKEMLGQCRRVAPLIFRRAGPVCETRGDCPEQNASCPRRGDVREGSSA